MSQTMYFPFLNKWRVIANVNSVKNSRVFLTFSQQFSFGSIAHVERSDGKELIKMALERYC